MNKFILNIIHRPEMVPEYAEKVTGHGKEEDLEMCIRDRLWIRGDGGVRGSR